MFSVLIQHLEYYDTPYADFIPSLVAIIKTPTPASAAEADDDDYYLHNTIKGEGYLFGDDMYMNKSLTAVMLAQTASDTSRPIIFTYIITDNGVGHFLTAVAVPTGILGEYDIDILPTYSLEGWMGKDTLIRINDLPDVNKTIRIRSVNDIVDDLDKQRNAGKEKKDWKLIDLQENEDTCSNWGFRIANLAAKYAETLNDVQLFGLTMEEDYKFRMQFVYKGIYDILETIPAEGTEFLKANLITRKYANGLPNRSNTESSFKSNTSYSNSESNTNMGSGSAAAIVHNLTEQGGGAIKKKRATRNKRRKNRKTARKT